MSPIFYYLLKVIGCSALLTGYYLLVLRQGRFFQWNRFYLLAAMVLSFTIPLLDLGPLWAGSIGEGATNIRFMTQLEEVLIVPQSGGLHAFWLHYSVLLALAIYTVGLLFLLFKESMLFRRMFQLKEAAELITVKGNGGKLVTLHVVNEQSAPFSFFGTIFWQSGLDPNSDDGRRILQHELAHVRLGHSWDKLLMQLVCNVAWFNPFFRIMRRELYLVHEFAADSQSVPEGDTGTLSTLILRSLYPEQYSFLTNHFYQSSIKRRIMMIANSTKNSKGFLRRAACLPIVVMALYMFSVSTCTDKAQTKALNFDEVDVKPMFNNGDANTFTKYINSVVAYPVKAMENNIQGTVQIDFDITEKGKLENIRVAKSVDPLLDEEAIRAIKTSPQWTPGLEDGKPVRVGYRFPIKFQLQ